MTAPCRTLNYALAQTTAGGTIVILSSGRYAPVTITKSVHIMADGVEAVLTGVGACEAVVCIDAGPSDIVSLRGITILVPGPYVCCPYGIRFLHGAGLHLDRSVIAGVASFGVFFEPDSPAHLHVFGSKLTASGIVVFVSAGGGPVHVVFGRNDVHDGITAFQFSAAGAGSIQATIQHSQLANQNGHSIIVGNAVSPTVPVAVMIDRSVVTNVTTAIEKNTTLGTVRMGDTVVSGLVTTSGAGAILSYGTNKVVEGIDGFALPNMIPLK